jgi:hypothetical protein
MLAANGTMAKRAKGGVRSAVTSPISTEIAAAVSSTVGRGRKGRDKVTRVTSPIKVVDTHARQWNRYSP